MLLGVIACAGFLLMAFERPSGLQDDARMFLSWMGRWDDPGLLRGDLMADYWRSVTPWFFRGLFRAAWWIGLEPLVFVKLLPAFLYLPVAFFSFRFLRAIHAEPLVAFLATAAVLYYFTRDGVMVSGTPRGVWPALLLPVLDGLARARAAQTALAQLCLAGCYPQLALVTAAVVGMTLLAPRRPWWLDLTKPRMILVAACAAATVAGVLPFLLASGGFNPVVSLAEARLIPTFGAAGRNRIFAADGSAHFLCGARLGFFGSKCKGVSDFKLPFLVLFALAGPLILFVRAVRAGPAAKLRSVLPLYLLAGSSLWFAASAVLLFRLHLPSRYTSAIILLMLLSSLPLLLEGIGGTRLATRLATRKRGKAILDAGILLIALIAAFGVGDARSVIRRPADPALIAAIRALPPDAVVAGFVEDLDFSPVLTGRSTLFSRELAIPYQLGYYRPLLRRMEDLRDAMLTADPSVLADRLRRNDVDLLLVPQDMLAHPRIPDAFRGFFGDTLAALEEQEARNGPSALSRLAAGCAGDRFSTVLALDASCLIRTGER